VSSPNNHQQFRTGPAVVGGGMVLIGLSGLVRNLGIIDHPWWLVLVLALIVMALWLAFSRLQALFDSDQVIESTEPAEPDQTSDGQTPK